MKRVIDFVSAELIENLAELAKRLGIDVSKYKPVMFESHPFFSIFCVDLEKSTTEKDFITKFEIIILELDRIDELISNFSLKVATDKKYLDAELNKGITIYYPESED